MKDCRRCIHAKDIWGKSPSDPDYCPDDDFPDEALVECTWNPGPLPPCWRWARREVVSAQASDAQQCPHYQTIKE